MSKPWWEQPGSVRWFVQLGTGAPDDAVSDAKLASEVAALPFGFRQALRAIQARLALDPLGERPVEPHDPERVRITRLSVQEDSVLLVATGSTVSVVARVHKPVGRVGTVRVVRVIPGP